MSELPSLDGPHTPETIRVAATSPPDLAKQWRAEADSHWKGGRAPRSDLDLERRGYAEALRDCARELEAADLATTERERIRQVSRECEATYPYRIELRGGDSYWAAVPFEDHPALVGERPAEERIAAKLRERGGPNGDSGE